MPQGEEREREKKHERRSRETETEGEQEIYFICWFIHPDGHNERVWGRLAIQEFCASLTTWLKCDMGPRIQAIFLPSHGHISKKPMNWRLLNWVPSLHSYIGWQHHKQRLNPPHHDAENPHISSVCPFCLFSLKQFQLSLTFTFEPMNPQTILLSWTNRKKIFVRH